MAVRFTKGEIEILSKNPNVKNVRENRLTLTFEFRCVLWEAWNKDKSVSCIRKIFKENGFINFKNSSGYFENIILNFRRHGNPSGGKNKEFGVLDSSFRTSADGNEFLISTGKFKKSGKGIQFTDEFINEIGRLYPQKSVEEILSLNGIDPKIVGYQRIYQLKNLLDGKRLLSPKKNYDDSFISKYSDHPYVGKINKKQLSLNDHFYEEASTFTDLHIDSVLAIFGFDPSDFDVSSKNRIRSKLNSWQKKNLSEIEDTSELLVQIYQNKCEELEKMNDNELDSIKEVVNRISKKDKKSLCEWIRDFNIDGTLVPSSCLYKKLGISKSDYYSILKNDFFGDYELKLKNKDESDLLLIKKVIESDLYPMGYRTVYMKMETVNGVKIGLHRIRRLMKKFELNPKIRAPRQSNIAARELLKRNRKSNILKRKFRFSRPLTTFLSDVSYLKYGINRTAYFSPVKDATSGRILGWSLSESNDLALVEDTLLVFEDVETGDGPLFHTDQGALYLTDTFQDMVKKIGLKESMSRRGNCWDNAPQESFFGHFKDECIYRNCHDIEELRKMVGDYIDYYNNRRPQWTRNRMTPVQYEKYLLDMDDEEFTNYQAKVKEQYDIMVESARDKAIKRARDIGALED